MRKNEGVRIGHKVDRLTRKSMRLEISRELLNDVNAVIYNVNRAVGVGSSMFVVATSIMAAFVNSTRKT